MDRNQRSSSFSIGFKSGERRKKQEKSMFRIKLMAKCPSFPPPPLVIKHAIVDSAIKTDLINGKYAVLLIPCAQWLMGLTE